jgi:4-amino-4-deoxy-L-arabinose transferase-like glycosyltransferase
MQRQVWQRMHTLLAQPLAASGLRAKLCWADLLLLAFGMLIYASIRLVNLSLFPIYFFCDEATQTNLAAELLQNGMRSAEGQWLPPYFRNVEKWSLSLTVYIQAISVALFGVSVEVTRTTSVVVSLFAGVAVALTLRIVFQATTWWAGPLILSLLPVWFLHSRTAFETVMMVAFYAFCIVVIIPAGSLLR